MSRRGNYPISMSWDYYDDPKRGALGLRSGKNWRWLLTLLLLLLLAALIIIGWQNNRDNDGGGNGNAAVPAASPSAVTAVPNAAYEGWRWVVPGGHRHWTGGIASATSQPTFSVTATAGGRLGCLAWRRRSLELAQASGTRAIVQLR